MRVLIVVEEGHRAYGDSIGGALEALRPHLEVVVAELKDLENIMAILEPDLVICGRSTPTEPATGALAWVELSVEPSWPTKVRVGEHCWEISNPTLEDLLVIVDKVEAFVKTSADLGEL